MKSYEATARTVEEAISQCLLENGLSIGDVNVEILEEGSKGLFGLFGSRDAKVRLTVIEETGSNETLDLFKNSLDSQPAPTKRIEKKPQEGNARPAKARKPAEAKPEEEEKPKPRERVRAEKPQRSKKPNPQQDAGEQAVETVKPLGEERVLREVKNPAPDSPEGQAVAFLQELTKLMGLDVTVSVSLDSEGHVFARMDGDPQGILIGRRGETLDALQYLTSLKINKERDNYIRVTLDSEGYRQKREDALVRLANRMANRAKKTGRRVTMEPMNPYERRIFHSALQSTPGILTHSEGEDLNRHIVITPVKDDK